LLSQVASCDTLVKSNKLHDIASTWLSNAIGQASTITIKLLHHVKVSVTNTDDDERDWVLRKLVDEVLGLAHIVNGTISQDQHHMVPHLALSALHHAIELIEQWCEVGRTLQINGLQRILVGLSDSLDRENGWVLYLSIDREAVADLCHAHSAVHASKTEGWEHSIEVVRLNDCANAIDRLDILVLRSKSVQRLRCRDGTV